MTDIKTWHDFIWQADYYCPSCRRWFELPECGCHCPNCGEDYEGEQCPKCGEDDYELICPECGIDGGNGGLASSDVWAREIEHQWPDDFARLNNEEPTHADPTR